MAIIVKTADDIAAGDRIAPNTGDTIIIEAGVTVAATGAGGDGIVGLTDENLKIFVNGVVAGEDNAIEAGAGGAVSRLYR